jgi:hypothetical protein
MAQSHEDDAADALAAMTGGSVANDVEPHGVPDEMLAAPAPDASVFAPRRTTRDMLSDRRTRNRRTLIPILLTCGVLMPIVGSLKWLRGVDSPFAAWSIWPPIALSACGLVLLTLAAANMIQVRKSLPRGGRGRHGV